LAALLDLDLLRREVPITERRQPRPRTSLYFLADHYLTFWYRYVDPARSLIARGLEARVLARVQATLHEHVSRPAFEDVCRQYLWRAFAAGGLPPDLSFDAVGTWWNGDHEINVVAMEGGVTTLVGSCKWTNAPVGLGELNALQRSLAAGASHLQPAASCWYALFTREGFHEELVSLARLPGQRLLLVTPTDLFAPDHASEAGGVA
jgi:hypothetical protein